MKLFHRALETGKVGEWGWNGIYGVWREGRGGGEMKRKLKGIRKKIRESNGKKVKGCVNRKMKVVRNGAIKREKKMNMEEGGVMK